MKVYVLTLTQSDDFSRIVGVFYNKDTAKLVGKDAINDFDIDLNNEGTAVTYSIEEFDIQ